MRTSLIVAFAVLAIVFGLVIGLALRDEQPEEGLSASYAAAALTQSTGFTQREGSPNRRELVKILAVRRIGQTSIEVEFNWRDVGPDGTKAPDVRTSLALFRDRGGNQWVLTSLYKVD